MKKVLLATSALVLTTGFAAAEITMSGSAEAGLHSAAGADHAIYSGISVDYAISGASDNGITFSTSFDFSGGSVLDGFDLDTSDGAMSLSAPLVEIGVSGYTVSVGQNAVEDLYTEETTADLGVSGEMGPVSFSLATGLEDDDTTSASVTYDAGAISATLATTDDNGSGDAATSVSASYTMGDITATLAHDTMGAADPVNTVTVEYSANGITVTAEADDADAWSLGAEYTTGALTVGASTDNDDAWEATVSYDLGGGATAVAGFNEAESSYAAISFSF